MMILDGEYQKKEVIAIEENEKYDYIEKKRKKTTNKGERKSSKKMIEDYGK